MKLKRVYAKHGAYYFVDTANKWHRLCAIADGEARLYREYAKRLDRPANRPGSMAELIRLWRTAFMAGYAQSTQDDYGLMLPKIEEAFEEIDVAEVKPADVFDFIHQWKDTPRQANKYRSLLSMLFKFACAPHRMRQDNPADQVDPLDMGPDRSRYINDAEFYAIRRGAVKSIVGHKVPAGDMMVCAIDLAYLTMQRQQEIRRLQWCDMDEAWIYFKPGKTKSTTGARVKVPRTLEINAVLERARSIGKVKSPYFVIHTLKGKMYTKSGLYTAWNRACKRAKVPDAHFHDLRAKAQTDAKRRGYTMQQIQDGAVHASVTTTEGYIKLREELESKIALPMPGS